MMLALAATYGLGRAAAARGSILSWLERLGRRSLFVYSMHVELVYGYATWPLRRKLGIFESPPSRGWHSPTMSTGFVVLRDRLVARWRTKGSAPSPLL